MALAALQGRVGFVEEADLAETVAEGDNLDLDRGRALVGIVWPGAAFALNGINEGIAGDTKLGGMRVMAHDAAHGVIDVFDQSIDIGGAVPLGLGILVPHVFPLQGKIGGLALQTDRIAGRGGDILGKGLLRIDQDVPGLARAGITEQVLELKAPGGETIDRQLVDNHEGMGARLVMFLGEAVRREKFILKGRTPGRSPLFLARLGIPVDPVEAGELILVAITADREFQIGQRFVRLALQMFGEPRMTGFAGEFAVL